jgi:hypothetical protein
MGLSKGVGGGVEGSSNGHVGWGWCDCGVKWVGGMCDLGWF